MSAPNRIKPLPLHLANQIAAGEVIERPASVVKELIENSLDAGATQIDIRIEGAGSQLIQVQDNGEGIHPDDLPLAVHRHATSKLHASEQLSRIESLGFRGEALPSIASVSLLTLTSRQQDGGLHGWQFNARNATLNPAPHPAGTTVEVRDLFFNVPARRHFLRSNKTEQHHILTTLHRLALSRFDSGFRCTIAGKTVLKLPPASSQAQQQQRLSKICGHDFVRNSLYLQQHYQDIALHGWIGRPGFHRPQTDIQFFFINGRVIRDRVIQHAIRQAYGEQIPAGRQAAFVLYLTLPLEKVDVNVHPTKHEVRFRDARLIHGLITRAIQDTLQHVRTEAKTVSSIPEQNKQIKEQPGKQYHSSSTPTQTAPMSSGQYGQITALLHQRYALCLTGSESMLIDCQKIELQQRRRQLTDAIEQQSLTARPVLVPIKIPLDTESLKRLHHAQPLLERFAIQLHHHADSVMITTIPALLTQANLTQLIQDIAQTLIQPEHTALQALLLQHLTPLPVTQLEHARKIIEYADFSLQEHEHYIKLDQPAIDSLFSKQETERT